MSPRPEFYGDDLAYIHDAGFVSFANGCAPGLLSILRATGINDGLVVDLGCGSGVWCKHLADTGHSVSGVDISPAMIALARRQVPNADFTVGHLWTYRFPPCRAITALGEVLCYRPDGKSRSLEPIFRKAHKCLEPSGLFIFDLAEVSLGQNCKTTSSEGTDWCCVVESEYDTKRERLVRHITSFRKIGTLYRRSQERHEVQLYRPSDVLGTLRRIGFRVRTVRKLGAYPLLPGRIGVIARKC
jgi:SAM-dependent methyltransferase